MKLNEKWKRRSTSVSSVSVVRTRRYSSSPIMDDALTCLIKINQRTWKGFTVRRRSIVQLTEEKAYCTGDNYK